MAEARGDDELICEVLRRRVHLSRALGERDMEAQYIVALKNRAERNGSVRWQAKALQAEAQKIQQDVAILAADAKAKKIAEFDAKQNAVQAGAQKKEQMIQGGFLKAQQTFAQALEPILQTLMQQRGANIILDKNAVVYAYRAAVPASARGRRAVVRGGPLHDHPGRA